MVAKSLLSIKNPRGVWSFLIFQRVFCSKNERQRIKNGSRSFSLLSRRQKLLFAKPPLGVGKGKGNGAAEDFHCLNSWSSSVFLELKSSKSSSGRSFLFLFVKYRHCMCQVKFTPNYIFIIDTESSKRFWFSLTLFLQNKHDFLSSCRKSHKNRTQS